MKVARITKYLALFMIMAMISACHDFTLSWKVRIFKNTKICFPAELLIVNKGIISSTKGDMSGKETLIIYYDESECSACVINHLAESVNKYKTISKSNGCNVVILFSPLPENAQEVLINLIDAHLNFPIYIVQYGEFRSLNPRIPDDKRFHSFLLNKNGYPIYVGNPLNSQKLFDIFIKTLETYSTE